MLLILVLKQSLTKLVPLNVKRVNAIVAIMSCSEALWDLIFLFLQEQMLLILTLTAKTAKQSFEDAKQTKTFSCMPKALDISEFQANEDFSIVGRGNSSANSSFAAA